MEKSTIAKLVGGSVAIAAGLVALVVLLTNLVAEPTAVSGAFNHDYVTFFPSVAKAASLALGFWGVVGIIVGSLLVGATVMASKLDITPTFGGDANGNKAVAETVIGIAAGILIFFFSYLNPAYNVQEFTHKTLPSNEAAAVKKADNLFTEKYQADTLYIKAFDRK